MDTRSKILETDDAVPAALAAKAEGKRLIVSYGEYDPVLAAHAERLSSRKPAGVTDAWHVVAVLPNPDALMPLRARCEVVAGLACVDCVVPFDQDPSLLGMAAGKAELHDDREADALTRDQVIAHIHAKQKLAQSE